MALIARCGCADAGDDRAPTPRIRHAERVGTGADRAVMMRARIPGAGWDVGLAALCEDGEASSRVQLGAFPERRQALQLAVRAADGSVERFGPAFEADSISGFHTPEIAGRDEIERFLRSAFTPVALVSNGFNSFFNDATPAARTAVLSVLTECKNNEAKSP